MKIAIAQINTIVGDISGNSLKIIDIIGRSEKRGARLVVFGELSLIGYPPKDLLLKPRFIEKSLAAINNIAKSCTNCSALVGFAAKNETGSGRPLHNAVALLKDGKVAHIYIKRLLPTYDVFDETRYFQDGKVLSMIEMAGVKIGLTICEDIWQQSYINNQPLYEANPFADLTAAGAEIIINMSASPFEVGKHEKRKTIFSAQCKQHQVPLVYVNQVGGNDELVFDGASCAFDAQGEVVLQAKDFQEDLIFFDTEAIGVDVATVSTGIASVYKALVLGLRDYVTKCGFSSVLLGLSGGIDSAVVATLAVDALGRDNVLGITMPSRYSSDGSVTDAEVLATNLGIRCKTIAIEPAHLAMETMLSEIFAKTDVGVAEENIQARTRGNVLMSISNKFGHLLLTTGNKSELAVGYCTLYGDMCGGLAVISDLPKMEVYALARFINRDKILIPESTISKPPSAELRPDQKDEDSLPPYEQLDEMLRLYVEQEKAYDDIVAAGFDKDDVKRIIGLVDRNEYKRKQAAPGIKITSRAFGFGRRMPIAQRYNDEN